MGTQAVRRSSRRFGQAMQALGYIAPALIVILLVIVFPLIYAFYISLQKVSGASHTFIGLANYSNILKSDYFWQSTARTLYFTVVSVGLEFLLGLGVALLLNENYRGRGFFRGLLILPWALPTVVNGVLWAWIFDANYGALNGLLKDLGMIDTYIIWLGHPFSAMNSVIFADVWKNFPMIALLLLAGLQTIPAAYYEAATIDGATRLQPLQGDHPAGIETRHARGPRPAHYGGLQGLRHHLHDDQGRAGQWDPGHFLLHLRDDFPIHEIRLWRGPVLSRRPRHILHGHGLLQASANGRGVRTKMKAKRNRGMPRKIFLYSMSILLAIFILAPFYWLFVSSSISTKAELLAVPVHWFPHNPTFDNYIETSFGGRHDVGERRRNPALQSRA